MLHKVNVKILLKMLRLKIVHFIFISLFPIIYSQFWPYYPSNFSPKIKYVLENENCPIYDSQEEKVILTYDGFRDSSDIAVRIYEKVEQTVSLSSFFITRNKQQIYQHESCINENYDERCEELNNECELNFEVDDHCIQIERTPILLYLEISNSTLQNIHPNTFVTVSKCLQHLILKQNMIKEIPQKAFKSLNNLKYLDLSENKLTNWDSSVLEDMQLNYLNISYNILDKLNEIEIGNIEILDISHNKLLQFNLNSTQENLLKYLNIANNKLDSIYLSNANNLQVLDISYNDIKSLTNFMLNDNKLDTLIASNNQIHEFDFPALTHLRFLNLSNNNIEFINSTVIPASLIDLDLSNNNIILSSKMFLYSSSLVQLFLNSNQINNIPLNTFNGLINLQILTLADNELNSFEFGSFTGLINLSFLDLSHNKLIDFESNKFMNLNNLQTLLLDGNKFDNLNLTDLNVKLYNLHTISLSNMSWTCENLLKSKNELHKMNINLKQISNTNQSDFNIDGINCIPEGSENNDPESEDKSMLALLLLVGLL